MLQRETMSQPMLGLKMAIARQMSNGLIAFILNTTVRAPLNTYLIPASGFRTSYRATSAFAATGRYFGVIGKVR